MFEKILSRLIWKLDLDHNNYSMLYSNSVTTRRHEKNSWLVLWIARLLGKWVVLLLLLSTSILSRQSLPARHLKFLGIWLGIHYYSFGLAPPIWLGNYYFSLDILFDLATTITRLAYIVYSTYMDRHKFHSYVAWWMLHSCVTPDHLLGSHHSLHIRSNSVSVWILTWLPVIWWVGIRYKKYNTSTYINDPLCLSTLFDTIFIYSNLFHMKLSRVLCWQDLRSMNWSLQKILCPNDTQLVYYVFFFHLVAWCNLYSLINTWTSYKHYMIVK